MPIYALDNIPRTTSWARQLDAREAIQQCEAWGIPPADTLEQNRCILRRFIKDHHPDLKDAPGSDQDDNPTNTNLFDNDNISVNDNVVNNAPDPSVGPTLPQALLPPPPLAELVQSFQQTTINSISHTVTSLVRELMPLSSRTEHAVVPPYLMEMFKELPKTNGASLDRTIFFFKQVGRIVALNLASEKLVILNAAPYTTDRLRDFWMEMVAIDAPWDHLLENWRRAFMTPDVLREYQTRYVYRRQRDGEGLAEFVREVQAYFKILSPATSEEEIFNTVFRGINPETRTTFAGLRPIESLEDLVKMAPLSNSFIHSQDQRDRRTFPSYNRNVSSGVWAGGAGQRAGYNPGLYRPRFHPSRPNRYSPLPADQSPGNQPRGPAPSRQFWDNRNRDRVPRGNGNGETLNGARGGN